MSGPNSNWFDSLRTSNEDAGKVEVSNIINIINNIKVVAGKSIGNFEIKKKKPCFDDEYTNFVNWRKTGQIEIFAGSNSCSEDNYHNERREISRTPKNKIEVT